MTERTSTAPVGWLAALIGALLTALAIRALRGGPIPANDARRPWNRGAAWPELDDPEPTDTVIDLTTGDADWVLPTDDGCPPDHPVKANLRSGIFHVPGGRFYDRTTPDRCYRDAEAAQRDGLRAARY